jgi:polygalacturonase
MKVIISAIFFLLIVSYSIAQDKSWETELKANLNALADSLTLNLKPWVVPDRIFRVEDFGAKGDGITLNTLAIQQAIDSCSKAGGGVVLFSNGDYVTGTIELKSGVMLEIAEGSRLLGSLNLADYPEKIEKFKSVMSENHKYRQSLIYAEKANKIGIRGKGEIYFRGEKTNFPGTETTGEIIGRPFGIRMIQCSQVVLQNIYLHNAAAWMQSYLYCNDLIFDSIKVVNQANYNNDGLDIDGCTNVIVRNCFINSEDDAMCMKGCSGMPTQNILIENSTFITTCNALKIGTDTQGPFRNIICRNLKLGGIPVGQQISIAGNQSSTGVTLATVDGGNVENISISNIEINQARCPIFIRVGNRGRVMPGMTKPNPGYLKKVVIDSVIGSNNYHQGSFISGINGYPVTDVIIRNYKISMEGGGDSIMAGLPVPENESRYPDAHQFNVNGLPAYGFYIRHAKNIYIENAQITSKNPDFRPCFIHGGDVENVFANGDKVKEQIIVDRTYKAK